MRPSPVELPAQNAPEDEPAGDDPRSSQPRSLIRDAAERVAAGWTNITADALDHDEVDAVLGELTEALERALQEHPAGVIDYDPSPQAKSVLGRRLLQLLRAELIQSWAALGDEAPETRDTIATLQAFETVQTIIEPDWSEFFASRLSSPDGLDLVVEVAHDLRSPLTSILFLAETLQRGHSGDVNEIQNRQLGLIYGAALGLSSLASNLIELARGGDRLVDDEPSPFSVTEVIEAVRDIVRPIAEEKGLTVRLQPPTTDHRLGHPIALSRVLLNLTTNALKFTDEGFVDLTARAKGRTHVEFSIKDTGDGIDPKTAASLYQPFQRAGGREGYRFSGTGLGLAISRKLVEAMGTELHVESVPGQGTTFRFVCELPPAGG